MWMASAWLCRRPFREIGRCRLCQLCRRRWRRRRRLWHVLSAAAGRTSKSGRARPGGLVRGWRFGAVVGPGRYRRRRPPAPSVRGRVRGVSPRTLTSCGLLLSSFASCLVALAAAGAAARERGPLLLPRSSTPELCAERIVSERSRTKQIQNQSRGKVKAVD